MTPGVGDDPIATTPDSPPHARAHPRLGPRHQPRSNRRIARGIACGFALLALLALGAAAETQPPADAPPQDREIHQPDAARAARAASEVLAAFRASSAAPGLSAAVAVDGKMMWSESQGYASLADQTPLLRSTPLRIGSTSKALTSAGLGKLVETGKLDLDEPIQRYVPTFPEKAHPITARQLASHRAGIRHYDQASGEYWSRERYKNVVAALAVFADDPLLFTPGSAYHYSTYGYTLLSAAIEGSAGQDFLAFMHAAVFDPAGMPNTGAEASGRTPPGASRFYVRSPWTGGITEAQPVDNSVKWAGGGFLSTSVDLVRFGIALLDDTLLTPETFRLLTTPHPLPGGQASEAIYALGWRHTAQALPASGWVVRTIHHGGTALGATSFLVLMPEERLVIAVNSNLHADGFAELAELTLRLAEIFLTPDDQER